MKRFIIVRGMDIEIITASEIYLIPEQYTPKKFPIYECDLSTRLYGILKARDILFLEDVTKLTSAQFLEFRNVGKHTLDELRIVLSKYGLKLNGE